MSSVNLKAALNYRRRNWMPVPVYPRQKNPIGDGWTELRLTEANIPQHFNDGQNVGILLGEPGLNVGIVRVPGKPPGADC